MKWILISIYNQVIYLIVYKEMVIRLLIELGRRIEKLSENFSKDLENIRKTNQS